MTRENPVRVVVATAPAWLDAVRGLFREYVEWLAIDLEHQGFSNELRNLPGKYAPPAGTILVAVEAGCPADSVTPLPIDHPALLGCVALRPIPATGEETSLRVCEMKRMWVRLAHQGRSVGRLLGEAVLRAGTDAGYDVMKLDSEPKLVAALGLYRSLGFTPCPRYNADPDPCTLYFSKRLTPPGPPAR